MEFNAGVFDLNGVFYSKNYVMKTLRVLDPRMHTEAKGLLARDMSRVENATDIYGLFPKNGINEKKMIPAVREAISEDCTIKPVANLIKKYPFEVIFITTNSGPYDTFLSKYKYLDPLTSAKIIPITVELKEGENGLMELNPDSFYSAGERGNLAKTVAKEYVTLTMGDAEGDDTNYELVRSGDLGLEFNDKSKRGFHFDKKQNLFTDVRYSDLPDIERIVAEIPQPKKEKTGFIEQCLNEAARETVQEGYFAVSPALCATGCVI